MNSNEEYLDSLLKAVTDEGQDGGLGTVDNFKDTMVNDISDEAAENLSGNTLEEMLANVENLEIKEQVPEDFTAAPEQEARMSDEAVSDIIGLDDAVMAEDEVPEDIFADEFLQDALENEQESYEEEAFELPELPEQDKEPETDSEQDVLIEDFLDLEAAPQETLEDTPDMEPVQAEEEPMDLPEEAAEYEHLPEASENVQEELSKTEDDAALPEVGEEDEQEENDLKEINDLLSNTSGNDDDVLSMLENVPDAEPVDNENKEEDIFDIFSMDAGEEMPVEEIPSDEQPELSTEQLTDEVQEPEEIPAAKKKKKWGRKKETEEQDEQQEEGSRKKGIFTKIVEFLTEEDEPEEEKSEDAGTEPGIASDENLAILQELDKEDTEKSGKGKKEKKKKGKKGQKKAGEETEEEAGDEKPKKEKKKKPKKEKSVKEIIEETEKPSKKLSKDKIIVTFIFAATVLIVILVIVIFIPQTMENSKGREAYYAKDYETVYQTFYGANRNENQELMFRRAESILQMQRKLDAYHNYIAMGKELEALDQLIQGYRKYGEISEAAQTYGVMGEVTDIYQRILTLLKDNYQLEEGELERILSYEDNLTYTLYLESVVFGTEFKDPNAPEEEPEHLEDVLPEEEDFIFEGENEPAMIPETEGEAITAEDESGSDN